MHDLTMYFARHHVATGTFTVAYATDDGSSIGRALRTGRQGGIIRAGEAVTVSNLTLRADSLNQPHERAALLALLARVFGNDDLTSLAHSGRWDPTFRSFGYWSGERCAANIGVFDMPLLMDDRPMRACGVQAVATAPEFRRRGLCTSLLREAMAYIDARTDLSLLFTARPGLYAGLVFRVFAGEVFLYRRSALPSVVA